jgi:hypothetical protein
MSLPHSKAGAVGILGLQDEEDVKAADLASSPPFRSSKHRLT